ncbi:uroporphyrinogen-III synthase [Paludibacterium denitrificans]|uniref:uroporphyrinogen-III synthase n=1 Tax=Paludibacterium denitrificans TaxID=2675226 RepID=UPI001E33D724|nr:uroporphyrinogen-III synthase [Paludibacterium denitrificans]
MTRPQAQSQRLLALLRAEGADAAQLDVLDIQPDVSALGQLPALAQQANWLIFVSPSAIDIARPALADVNLEHVQLACVGAASAARLAALSGREVLHPTQGSDSDALLALPPLAALHQQHVIIVRGKGGRATLGETLAARGAQVTLAEVYRRAVNPDWNLLDSRPPDAILVTSSEIVERMFQLAGPHREGTLQCLLYGVPHPRIAEKLMAHGVTRIVTTRADDAALIVSLPENGSPVTHERNPDCRTGRQARSKTLNAALLVALAALGLSGWQYYTTQQELTVVRQELARKLAEGNGSAKEIRSLSDQALSTARSTDGKLALLEARVNEAA